MSSFHVTLDRIRALQAGVSPEAILQGAIDQRVQSLDREHHRLDTLLASRINRAQEIIEQDLAHFDELNRSESAQIREALQKTREKLRGLEAERVFQTKELTEMKNNLADKKAFLAKSREYFDHLRCKAEDPEPSETVQAINRVGISSILYSAGFPPLQRSKHHHPN